jgi:hypothetical protein
MRSFKIQMFGHQPSWSGHASYLYGNCVQLKCDRPDEAQIGKEFQQNFGKPIAQLSFRTPYDYRPKDAWVLSSQVIS